MEVQKGPGLRQHRGFVQINSVRITVPRKNPPPQRQKTNDDLWCQQRWNLHLLTQLDMDPLEAMPEAASCLAANDTMNWWQRRQQWWSRKKECIPIEITCCMSRKRFRSFTRTGGRCCEHILEPRSHGSCSPWGWSWHSRCTQLVPALRPWLSWQSWWIFDGFFKNGEDMDNGEDMSPEESEKDATDGVTAADGDAAAWGHGTVQEGLGVKKCKRASPKRNFALTEEWDVAAIDKLTCHELKMIMGTLKDPESAHLFIVIQNSLAANLGIQSVSVTCSIFSTVFSGGLGVSALQSLLCVHSMFVLWTHPLVQIHLGLFVSDTTAVLSLLKCSAVLPLCRFGGWTNLSFHII